MDQRILFTGMEGMEGMEEVEGNGEQKIFEKD